MTNFLSCHLIVDRDLPNDCRHVRDFIDADFLSLERYSTLFLKSTPFTNANNFSHRYAHFGKTLDTSTTNDSTSTVFPRKKSTCEYELSSRHDNLTWWHLHCNLPSYQRLIMNLPSSHSAMPLSCLWQWKNAVIAKAR